MPVDFLTTEQEKRYGRYTIEPDSDQLARYFHIDDADRILVAQRRGDYNRLGFALQLCTVRFLGTFISDPTEVPPGAVVYVAHQIGVKHPVCITHYKERPATHREHSGEIRHVYGYRDFHQPASLLPFLRWLYSRAWVSERKVLLPGVTVLARLVARVRDRAANRLWKRLAQIPDSEQKERLEALIIVPQGERQTPLDRLRRGPSRVSGPALVNALHRLQEIQALGVGNLDLQSIPPGRLKALARFAAATWTPNIGRMPQERRMATLLAFARHFEIIALDEALDVLDALLTDLNAQAKREGQKGRLRTLGDLDMAAIYMRIVCGVVVDDTYDLSRLRQEIFARVPKDQIQQSIATVDGLTRSPDDAYNPELTERYGRVRRFLPTLLKMVTFQATQAGQSLLKALEFLRSLESQRKPYLSKAPLDVVSPAWKRLVIGKNKQIDRAAYTLCVLQQLQERLRRRDIFVARSERWGNPRAKLLNGAVWESVRTQICRTLQRDTNGEAELRTLSEQLNERYHSTASHLSTNTAVTLSEQGGKTQLILSGLDKLEEPPSLLRLRTQVDALLPRVDLPELLLEIHQRTGFMDEFIHLTEGGTRIQEMTTSVCAALIAEACNIGLEPVMRRDNPALTRDRLSWVQQNYFRAETLTRANARLVEAQTQISLAQSWGGGEVASADGLRFVVPVRTLSAGSNPKYFGVGKGITYYNFTSNQFTGFHGIVIPGTTHEAPYILEGLLEQQTVLKPVEIMADTAAYSDVIFGLFYLLGYQFSPRLADIGATRFWRMDKEANYGPLDGLARHRISSRLILSNWEDMLRVAGSLKLGTISASELIRSLLHSKRPSTLTRALGELGKINKTLYLLPYIDDETYRRRILTQLNRHERRHNLAREVFHGRRGEVRQRYREGQEDQLGALGLVVNAIVLWNTLYMDAALNYQRQTGVEVREEDTARLWPLGWEHVNFLGRFSFALSELVARGEMRDLVLPEGIEERDP